MPKLTKRTIDAIEPQATEFFLWDEGIPGFGLRAMVVVVLQEGYEGIPSLFRSGVGRGVGPFAPGSRNEALGLAVGFRRVGFGALEFYSKHSQSFGIEL